MNSRTGKTIADNLRASLSRTTHLAFGVSSDGAINEDSGASVGYVGNRVHANAIAAKAWDMHRDGRVMTLGSHAVGPLGDNGLWATVTIDGDEVSGWLTLSEADAVMQALSMWLCDEQQVTADLAEHYSAEVAQRWAALRDRERTLRDLADNGKNHTELMAMRDELDHAEDRFRALLTSAVSTVRN